MTVEIVPRKLSGTVRVPASKSMAHRLLICAALAPGKSKLSGVDMSRDIQATIDVLQAFGAEIHQADRTITVEGIRPEKLPRKATANCCESGSTLRFLVPVAAALGIETTFLGEGRLPQRPITSYLRELPQKGMTFHYDNTMPFSMTGKLKSGVYHLEGDVSSQYITGLLFALALLDENSEIQMMSPLESKPYVDLTISCLRQFGITVKETASGYFVPGGQTFRACDCEVEGDYSQAAFFLTANALGSTIALQNLNSNSVQGDREILRWIDTIQRENCFTVDARNIPDLVPILSVLATFGAETSYITNAYRLTLKESNRLQTTAEMLNALGGHVLVLSDGLEIHPVATLNGGTVDSFGDHRIAMSAAIAATRCIQPVKILRAESVEKSYPNFYSDYQNVGGEIHGIVLES